FTTGGSGTGIVSYAVLSGPGDIQNLTQLSMMSGSGMVQITSTKATDAMYAAQTVTAQVSCARADQTITFPATPDQLITNILTLNAEAQSLLPITYAVLSGPGSLSGPILSFSATGRVAVTAVQTGNTNWNPSVILTNALQVFPILPQLTTRPAGTIDQSSFDAGGIISFDGGAPVTQRGICWATHATPTIHDSITHDHLGAGSFQSTARGLDPSTTYAFCAYAINEVGIRYGDILYITTSNAPPPPPPVTYTWNGWNSDRWDDADNWGGYVMPLFSNTACFYESGASNRTIDLNGMRSVQAIRVLSNATKSITLFNGSLMLTNESAVLATSTGMLTFADTVIATSLLIENDGSLILSDGLYADGSVSKLGAGPLTLSGSSQIKGSSTIRQGILYAEQTIVPSNQVVICEGAALAIGATNALAATSLTITNYTPASPSLTLHGTLNIDLYSNTCDHLNLGANQLILGSNSLLNVTLYAGRLNETGSYTIATFNGITGTFARVNGLTAHILNISSNAITLSPSFVWDGNSSSNWSDSQNWTNSTGVTPGPENDAGFVSTTNNLVINIDTNPSVRSMRASGEGSITLSGSGQTIILTNQALQSGSSPALSAQDATLVIQCDIQTIPGARFTALQSSTNSSSIRIEGTIAPATESGNLVLDGNGSIHLAGTNLFGSASNALEISGANVYISEARSLGAPETPILFTNNGTLHITNSMSLDYSIHLAGNGNINISGTNTLRLTNGISGAGTLHFTGSGTIILSASNLTGGAAINCDALDLQGTLSGSDTIAIQAPATLRGNGRIILQSSTHVLCIESGARCAPGNSVGILTVNGFMAVDGTLDIEIENSSNDVIRVRDTLTINPGAVLNLIGTPDNASTYTLTTHDSRSGFFTTVNIPQHYTLDYSATHIALVPGSGAQLGETNILREGSALTATLEVSSNTAWSAISTSDWVTITSPTNGRGPAIIQILVAPNEHLTRKTILWIAGLRYLINQQPDRAVPLDFDGDGRADIAVYSPEQGMWYILQSSLNTGRTQAWGWEKAWPTPGDYDGDGLVDIAVYIPESGAWYIWQSATQTPRTQAWGWNEAQPVPADYDGDGIADLAVYDPTSGAWHIWQSATQLPRLQFWGWDDAQPVPADYDGDGIDDLAIYAPASGIWNIWQSATQTARIQSWGWDKTTPVPADYDGDGLTDIAVFWPEQGMWYIWLSDASLNQAMPWGWNQTFPVPADYDGDGKADCTVYAPQPGIWYLWQSATQTQRSQSWGWNEAEPLR
ncbi:MAG: FG-GAP-like repeat-containing protein, partial [Kiritimatiellae bacterium]|nr:FG-GAP-like repeat-containing protein [Kiritimatiellia bacterium]